MNLIASHSITRRWIRTGLAMSLGSLPLFAQADSWVKQAPLPSSGTISSVAAISASEFWCTPTVFPYSNNGHVAHTLDAGLFWEVDQLDLGGATALFFLDAQHGWSAGGAFRHTTDGGQTWITDNNWGSIYDIFFVDTQHGWAGGNGSVTYYTTDGGLNWTAVSVPGGHGINSIWFHDTLNGWAVGGGGEIYRSADGGVTWTVATNAAAGLTTIQFVSPLEGWAIGGDTFLHTTDGGNTWNPATVPAGTNAHAARFYDPLNGVAVGQGGNIVLTADGGQTWTTIQPVGAGFGYTDVEYGDALTVVCSGAGGLIRRSLNGGLTWATMQSGGWGIVHSVNAHDEQLAWATSQGGEVLRTTNGGQRWDRIQVDGFGANGYIYDVDFSDTLNGWAVGKSTSFGPSDGLISHSSDGGQSWTSQLVDSNSQCRAVSALDTQRAIVYGRGSTGDTYRQTWDGGQTWISGGPPAANGFTGASFLDDALTGWMVGEDIYHTTDGGVTWTLQFSGSGALLEDISFADANNGWVVGYANQVRHTTNGGQTWTSQNSGAPAGTGIMGVHAVDATTAWISGWNGLVARTTNGGLTWQQETIAGTSNSFFECAEFTDEDTGWIAGDYGIFRRGGALGCPEADTYCSTLPSTIGSPAGIGYTGTCEIANGDFALRASPLPQEPYIFYFGTTQVNQPFGNGTRCVGGTVTRLYPHRRCRNAFLRPERLRSRDGGRRQLPVLVPRPGRGRLRFQPLGRDASGLPVARASYPARTGAQLYNSRRTFYRRSRT